MKAAFPQLGCLLIQIPRRKDSTSALIGWVWAMCSTSPCLPGGAGGTLIDSFPEVSQSGRVPMPTCTPPPRVSSWSDLGL